MAFYLKKFENHTQYENYINGSSAILPNVSLCTTEGDVFYNPYVPPTPVETRLVAKFDVDDTSSPTQIVNVLNEYSKIEIDGVEQPYVTSGYTFSTTGEHTVKYTLTDPTSIGILAFYGCSGLTSIDIPNSVTSIDSSAFGDCTRLTSIDIPNSVTSIGDYAFYYCTSLTSIDLPSGVTSIVEGAFNGCSGLTSVTLEADVPPTLGPDVFSDTNDCPIYVPSGSVDAYKSASGWSSYASRIQAIS